MSGRMILLSATALLLVTNMASAQDLGQYDPAGYSGGYAEGASGPLGADTLYPYDHQQLWQHGYIQYMPFYGGYKHFRPYNYKNVLSQAQTAGGWGMSPKMPYSQQFWHRYHEQSRMSHAPTGAYQALPTYRQQQPMQQNYLPSQPYMQSQPQFAPTQQFVPTQPTQIQPAPMPQQIPQQGEALQFNPAPSPTPHTGISYQQPVYQQLPAIQVPNAGIPVPQSNRPNTQQPLLIAP